MVSFFALPGAKNGTFDPLPARYMATAISGFEFGQIENSKLPALLSRAGQTIPYY
jgi:hypothetical protein